MNNFSIATTTLLNTDPTVAAIEHLGFTATLISPGHSRVISEGQDWSLFARVIGKNPLGRDLIMWQGQLGEINDSLKDLNAFFAQISKLRGQYQFVLHPFVQTEEQCLMFERCEQGNVEAFEWIERNFTPDECRFLSFRDCGIWCFRSEDELSAFTLKFQ